MRKRTAENFRGARLKLSESINRQFFEAESMRGFDLFY